MLTYVEQHRGDMTSGMMCGGFHSLQARPILKHASVEGVDYC